MITSGTDADAHTGDHRFAFTNICFENITETLVAQHTPGGIYFDHKARQSVTAIDVTINQGVFTVQPGSITFPEVTVVQQPGELLLVCSCQAEHGKLCQHQAQVLAALIKREELGSFFNATLRHQKIKKVAMDYGLENESDLDSFFDLTISNKLLVINPVLPSLLPVTNESLSALANLVADDVSFKLSHSVDQNTVVVIRQHKYYQYLFVELYCGHNGKDGRIKNPLTLLSPLDFVWQTDDADEIKFFMGISRFQNHLSAKKTTADITSLRAIFKNPLGYAFYYHDSAVSTNITASSIMPVQLAILGDNIKLIVTQNGQFQEVSGSITANKKSYPLTSLSVSFGYFILIEHTLYLVDSLHSLSAIEILKKRQGSLLIHTSRFKQFNARVLSKLENRVTVIHQTIKKASPKQLEQHSFNAAPGKIIYLSDFGSHVMIIPVMRYGEVEISIRTKKQIYAEDSRGRVFMVHRDDEAEIAFTALLTRQHPYFDEQLENDLHYFYLHKKHFLDEEWFLRVFDEWTRQDVTVLGFNELEGNKLNPNKVKITINVLSGINWFNAVIKIAFGRRRASLKQVYKAVKNKHKYVQLDDGTLGILPAEWIERFLDYFNSGEIADEETLRIPKTNFTAINKLFDTTVIDHQAKREIESYRDKFNNFEVIEAVGTPAGFIGTLRPYQQQGLNWLNFLDDFNFGGCLADDMGLGKTVQIIAFILLQRSKATHNTNLLVVPATLIFNWQTELKKFAPSITVHNFYGADRVRSIEDFEQFEVIITSYSTLVMDIVVLKEYQFNYVFLDESQNIKNPDSQRYKAARLLKSRNKIAITGTPVENNTFDLYGQLSFACPGFLGSKQYFKDIYAVPIDKFKSNKRAAELQKKILPFVLRRTKQQVAAELPEKTEMVLYCEMQPEQRSIYDAYEKEFRDYISATTSELLAKSAMNVLKGLTRLRQICDSPVLLSGDKPPGESSAKIDTLMEQIESKSPLHKILVFSQFVGMLDLVKKKLYEKNIAFCYLTGATRNRGDVVASFQNDATKRVFLISLKAGGTGLNLTGADYVYLLDPWWNPAVENQAIDRAHRIGQRNKVVAVKLICPNTVEEKILLMQETKRDLFNGLINTDTSVVKSLSRTDLLELLK